MKLNLKLNEQGKLFYNFSKVLSILIKICKVI